MSSKQPRKQRKARYTAKFHERHAYVSVHLSKELREKLKTEKRNVSVRKGDMVKIMVGKYEGKKGKVARVNLAKARVFIEGVTMKQAKGTEKLLPINPSNLLLLEADFSDKFRRKALDRS